MGQLLSYSLYAGIFLIALYLPYKWALAGEAQHSANRAILLLIYMLALVALPLTLAVEGWLTPRAPAGIPQAWVEMPLAATVASEGRTLTLADVCLWIYVAGMAAVALHTLYTWSRLARMVHSGEKRPCGRFTLVLTDNRGVAPFSWMRYIVMSHADYEEAGEMIVCHETRHLSLGHPLDLLLAQAVAVIEWWNPAAWLMREELKAVHEYQADRAVLASGINARQYQMLLIKKAVGARFPSLANSLNHSKLKKRITMMYNQNKPARRAIRVLAMLPALAAAVLISQIPAVARAMQGASDASLTIPASSEAAMQAAAATGKVSSISSSVQEAADTPAAMSDDEEVHQTVEVMPEFPGGMQAMISYIGSNMKYPADAMKAGQEGRVVVKFVIDKNGRPGQTEVIRSVSPSLDAEAVRVIESMPSFSPGTLNGKPVAVYYTLPVQFKLKGDDKPAKNTPRDGNSTLIVSSNGAAVAGIECDDSGAKTVITLSKDDKASKTASLANADIYIDGKAVTQEEMNALNPAQIKSMTINKKKDGKSTINIETKAAN